MFSGSKENTILNHKERFFLPPVKGYLSTVSTFIVLRDSQLAALPLRGERAETQAFPLA